MLGEETGKLFIVDGNSEGNQKETMGDNTQKILVFHGNATGNPWETKSFLGVVFKQEIVSNNTTRR